MTTIEQTHPAEVTGSPRKAIDDLLGSEVGQKHTEAYSAVDAARDFVLRFVALSDIQADCVALWCAHTWCIDAFDTTPYLAVQSVEPGAGKTTLLEVCEQLVANPWLTGRTTGPALVYKVSQDKPTLLLDETDALFSGGAASQQMLRGVLNSGYKRNGKVSYAKGGSFVDLPVFCPKMFAGLTELPGTVADRSIPIKMRKKTAFDTTERFRIRDVRRIAEVPRMMLIRFGITNLETLAKMRPQMPSELDDRASDCWEPLLCVADLVGGTWPERARKAAVELMKNRKISSAAGQAFHLLGACKDVFHELGIERVQTSRLLEMLNAQGEAELTAITLADSLRGFGIQPLKIRFGKSVCQGYERSGFDSTWENLVPTVPTTDETNEA